MCIRDRVTDVIELFRPQTAECRLKLDVHLAVLENEAVIGDSLRIRQVYINILSNAVKYTPSDGKIRVDVRQVKESHNGYSSFIFRCSDTGIGMSEEFQKRLFEPFERVQDTTSSKIVGTGLGMAITKNLVDLMDGSIRVESKLGKGSSFTVSIPLKLQAKGPETCLLYTSSVMVSAYIMTCPSALRAARPIVWISEVPERRNPSLSASRIATSVISGISSPSLLTLIHILLGIDSRGAE